MYSKENLLLGGGNAKLLQLLAKQTSRICTGRHLVQSGSVWMLQPAFLRARLIAMHHVNVI